MMEFYMSKIFYILPLLGIFFFMGACEGHYRYPCQDPANWDKLECNNDVCKAEGTCTADVLAPAGSREYGADPQQNPLQESADEITTDTCSAPAAETDYEDDSKKVDFRVKRIEVPRDQAEVMDPEGDEYEAPTPVAPAEQPLSMNTVVDTAAHNAAVK
jgi:hypothetical protein